MKSKKITDPAVLDVVKEVSDIIFLVALITEREPEEVVEEIIDLLERKSNAV